MKEKLWKKLFELTEKSLKMDEFPVSAIIYDDNYNIISCGYNKRNTSHKTTDHAEIIAIEKANKKKKSWKLTDLNMIVTLEPCEMCKTVIKEARIKKITYLVDRYNFKKQYKCTIFKKYNIPNELISNYINEIEHFFDSKRKK